MMWMLSQVLATFTHEPNELKSISSIPFLHQHLPITDRYREFPLAWLRLVSDAEAAYGE